MDEQGNDSPINFQIRAVMFRMEQGSPVTSGNSPGIRLLHDGKSCSHSNGVLEVDEIERTVTCLACKARLDPFEAMIILARCERRMQQQYEAIEKERRMQRGFYAVKRTLEVQRCRHTRTYNVSPDGTKKCVRCDKIIDGDGVVSTIGGSSA